ncbi:nucleotide exchange factor GrpE [Mesomycoplasma lagogenitalium]|uniref:Protein GrpE n=1 Tax=Mesomycoplasma lagogenitalium TaxID=171286 RepID=A0ABY8LTR6_9BACT|nr:nucleotide exchange factor GrpE [Mesomycoplasma lagogenitalium]WGI36635.1 nucleotide exchange factor GrpE [Mesomycoplasma lagogenitalium]
MEKEKENSIENPKKNQTKKSYNSKTQNKFSKRKESKKEEKSLSEKYKIKISLLELENEKLKLQLEKNNEELKNKAIEIQQKAKEEIQKHKDENFSKVELELTNIKKYGIQKFFESFLIPLRNFELAISAGEKQNNPAILNYVKGFSMLFKQIEQVFADFGISKIEPYVGQEFDAELHDVFETIEDEQLKDKIISVKSNGYKLYDRVIKPAVVVVGK